MQSGNIIKYTLVFMKQLLLIGGGFPHLEAVLHTGCTNLKNWLASLHHCMDLQQVVNEVADIPSFKWLDLFRSKRAISSLAISYVDSVCTLWNETSPTLNIGYSSELLTQKFHSCIIDIIQ